MPLPGTSKPSTMAKCIGALLWNTRPIAPADGTRAINKINGLKTW